MSKFEFERLPLSNLTEETKKKSNKIKIAILAVVLVTACYFIFSKGSTPKVNGTASIQQIQNKDTTDQIPNNLKHDKSHKIVHNVHKPAKADIVHKPAKADNVHKPAKADNVHKPAKANNVHKPAKFHTKDAQKEENYVQLAKTRQDTYQKLIDLVKANTKSPNYILSPASLDFALALLAEGLEPEARAELDSVLGYSSSSVYSDARLDAIKTKLNQSKNEEYVQYFLTTTNSIWAQNGLKINKNYVKTLQSKYRAEAKEVDFKKSITKGIINQWISKNTGGMIKDFLKKINPDTIIMLMNAIYFKGNWENKFSEDKTKKRSFKNFDGTKKKVDMMLQSNHFLYFEDENFEYLRLNYNGIDVKMVLALPKESGKGKQPDLDVISNPGKYKFERKMVDLYLPKFKMDTMIELNPILEKLGLSKIFSTTAIGKKMLEEEAVVSQIVQKAIIEVDENGTKAAAITVIMIETTSYNPVKEVPLEYKCNRPFSYYLVYEGNGQIDENFVLFAGQINKF